MLTDCHNPDSQEILVDSRILVVDRKLSTSVCWQSTACCIWVCFGVVLSWSPTSGGMELP